MKKKSQTQKSLSLRGHTPLRLPLFVEQHPFVPIICKKLFCNFSKTLWKVYKADTYKHICGPPSSYITGAAWNFGLKSKNKNCHVTPMKKKIVMTHLWKKKNHHDPTTKKKLS